MENSVKRYLVFCSKTTTVGEYSYSEWYEIWQYEGTGAFDNGDYVGTYATVATIYDTRLLGDNVFPQNEVAYIASIIEDKGHFPGQKKVVLRGNTSPEMITAFTNIWAKNEGLVNIFSDPDKGYAGGYIA